jgi:hypothetical protein
LTAPASISQHLSAPKGTSQTSIPVSKNFSKIAYFSSDEDLRV